MGAQPSLNEAEEELRRIRALVLEMCVRGESMVGQAVRSVVERDPHLARAVLAADRALDELEVRLDGLCVRFLAMRQPTGLALRTVTATLKMVTELERIGDLAVNVAERGLDLTAARGMEASSHLPRMGEHVVEMFRLAADAYVGNDASVEPLLSQRDDAVDELNRAAFKMWLAQMADHPDQADRALAFTSISRYLERIGDHIVNLGQLIVLMVEGRDVRHDSST